MHIFLKHFKIKRFNIKNKYNIYGNEALREELLLHHEYFIFGPFFEILPYVYHDKDKSSSFQVVDDVLYLHRPQFILSF